MELRHLRYFVAVAEAGSLKVAAHQRLHTTQPSLSRQIRDLEEEIGAILLTRSSRGITLTAAGRVFLDHAKVVLSQVDVGVEAARRLADPAKPYFVLGFMIGLESTWLPEALELLRDELPGAHVVVSSQASPQLALALSRGLIDAAFLRREKGVFRPGASIANPGALRTVHAGRSPARSFEANQPTADSWRTVSKHLGKRAQWYGSGTGIANSNRCIFEEMRHADQAEL